jgi:hypothetical protein
VERRTAALQAALDAKTILRREVDHRVKNNLKMIGLLLRLQVRKIDDPEIMSELDSIAPGEQTPRARCGIRHCKSRSSACKQR